MPRAQANGIDLEYECIGDGAPLLLIMGIGAQLIHWPGGLCERLVAQGFKVIRFDNRDTGLSTKIEGAPTHKTWTMVTRGLLGLQVEAPYTLDDMADDAVGLLDALNVERAHVVGASMGGMIAQTMALRHPDRLFTLTSIMSHPGDIKYAVGTPKSLLRLLAPAPTNRNEAMDNAIAFYAATGSTGFEQDEVMIRTRAGHAFDRCFYPQGFKRQMAAILASGSRSQALKYLRVPTLVIHGSADCLIRPAGGRATAQAIPGAKLEIVEGMGHDLPEGVWPLVVAAISQHAQPQR
ncbi:MAG: alpha/beta hydrolase [Polyangiaceae bacterium]